MPRKGCVCDTQRCARDACFARVIMFNAELRSPAAPLSNSLL